MALRKWISVWVIPVLLVFSVLTVWLRLQIVRMTYSVNQIEKKIQQMREEKEILQVKVAGLKSPRRLDLLAKKHFQLVSPRVEQIIYLRKELSTDSSLKSEKSKKFNQFLIGSFFTVSDLTDPIFSSSISPLLNSSTCFSTDFATFPASISLILERYVKL